MQLCETFPLAAIFLSDTRYCDNPELIESIKRAREMVCKGESLKKIAEELKLPFELRKIKPQPAKNIYWPIRYLYEYNHGGIDTEKTVEYYSKILRPVLNHNTRIQSIATLCIKEQHKLGLEDYAYTNKIKGNTDFIKWVIKQVPTMPVMGKHESIRMLSNMADWVFSNMDLGIKKFNEKISYSTAVKRSNDWHMAMSLLHKSKIKNTVFSPPPIEGTVVDGYEIIPLICTHDLIDEGNIMNHCVGGYTSFVLNGHSYVYSIRKDGHRIATLDINPKIKIINQLQGPENTSVDKKVTKIITKWIKQSRSSSKAA